MILSMPPHLAIALALLCTVCVGCAATSKYPAGDRPEELAPGIYVMATGERIEPEALYDELAKHRYVLLGESHDDAWHHDVQLMVYRAVSARTQGPVALGMEMFQRPFQPGLDAYTAAEIEEDEMLSRTEYAERWGFDVELYRPLWVMAREQGASVVALNARKEITRTIAKRGLDALPEEYASTMPELDLTNEAHRAWMRGIFSGHGGMQMDDATFERFYTAQVTWDETMADSAYRFMQANPEVGAMVVLAGSGHVMSDFGIPSRLARREGSRDDIVTLIPITLGGPARLGAQAGLTRQEFERLRAESYADFVWVGGGPQE